MNYNQPKICKVCGKEYIHGPNAEICSVSCRNQLKKIQREEEKRQIEEAFNKWFPHTERKILPPFSEYIKENLETGISYGAWQSRYYAQYGKENNEQKG